MKYFNHAVLTIAFIIFSSFTSFAQESQTTVIDEVVAQVNDTVITLSQIKVEEKNAVTSLVQEGKTQEEAQKIVTERKGLLSPLKPNHHNRIEN